MVNSELRVGRKMNTNPSNNTKYHVIEQIKQDNTWFTSSQFQWAEKENIKRIYAGRYSFFKKHIEEALKINGEVSILDYGCGDGYWSKQFSNIRGCEITGTDYNPLRLERARKIATNPIFIEADLTKENVNLGKYDIVFCSQVIEHIGDDLNFLINLKNHIKPGGILILGTPNEGSLGHRIRNYFMNIQTDHTHFYTERKIKRKIKLAGFMIINTYREVFFPGVDKIYYKLTSTDSGFKLLEILTLLFPWQCSDFYFVCSINNNGVNR